MALSAIRKIPLAVLLMLGCSAMSVPAQAGWFDLGSKSADAKPAAKPDSKTATNEPATNLEDSIRQAQMLRLAGQYPEAIRHLSQLMMVASDDGHVIAEYGKTLAAMGRANDAVNFLTRAEQLQPGDWTIYSALGVAYDQIGDQKSAQQAYEHALTIKPEEPSVLNNYALSRMLAKDPDMARKLALRAETAGGNSDAKIARNIAMIHSLAVAAPAPVAAPVAAQAPQAAPQTPVAHNQIPGPIPGQAAAQAAHDTAPQAAEAHDNRVVMQRVPVDPLAGPVHPAKTATAVATQAPHPLQPAMQSKTAEAAKPVAPSTVPVVKAAEASKPVPAAAAPVKTADTKPAPAKTADAVKPVAVSPSSTAVFTPLKLTDTKPAPAKTAEAAKPVATTPSTVPVVKAAEASKPVAVPSFASLKTADTKPAPAKTAEAAKPVPVPASSAAVFAPLKLTDTKPAPAKTAEAAKPVATTPSAVPVVKAAEASKPVPAAAAPVKTADTKPAPAKTADAVKPAAVVTLKIAPPPVKAADAGKPALAPKVLPPVKTVAKAKDAIPGLRLSANAY